MPTMTTAPAAGHNAFTSARRSASVASHVIVP